MTDRISDQFLLDKYLTQWAAQNALSVERADAIRRAILAAPPLTTEALSSDWWHQFSDALAATLQKSAQRSPFPAFFTPLPAGFRLPPLDCYLLKNY